MHRKAVCLLALLLFASAAHAERVRSFDVQIQPDGADRLQVSEHIRYDFGDAERHGIFRVIPVRYSRGRSAPYHVALDVESVTDGQGRALHWRVRREGSDEILRIGDPSVLVSGVKEYWIRYGVRRAVLYFQDHDEIYWNATGNDWHVPIESAELRLVLPKGTSPDRLRIGCFTGVLGSRGRDCSERQSADSVSVQATQPLAPGEGLSVVVGFPKGILREPSRLDRLLDRLSDFLSPFALLPLLVLGFMGWTWRRHGRDPQGRAAIEVRYEPPEGLTPSEVGTLLDERVDLTDITSSILDLAVKGFLRIEEVESQGFLFFDHRDWNLVKLREPEGLQRHEVLLMTSLFATGSQVRVSELRNRFYVHLPDIREALYDRMTRTERLFAASPERVRSRWAVGGGVVLAAGFVMSALGMRLDQFLPVIIAGGIVIGFSRVMPRRTARGHRLLEEILGFREFVERVDKDRLERSGGRSAGRFERILPFAMVLGVGDSWANAFADIYREPPSWYSPRSAGVFAPRLFVADLGRSFQTIGQTLQSRPSGGSGASGFGGGGFSGGGFGGGGGGSW